MNGLVTYRPRGLRLMDSWDRLLDSFFDEPTLRRPLVDVREEKDRYVLEAELPGLDEKDIDVKVEENLLTISSRKEDKREEKKNGYVLKERRSSSFSRSFVLPAEVDRDKISAHFDKGVLTLEMPKLPEKQPKRIEIKKS